MSIIDTGLLIGPCPFRKVPSSVADVAALHENASLDRVVATGFRSLLYYDPIAGLEQDIEQYKSLADWLHFYAVINPNFPRAGEQVAHAIQERQIVGLRLIPALHHYDLNTSRIRAIVQSAGENGLPLNLMARVFDDRMAPRYVNQLVPAPAEICDFLRTASDATVILSMFYFTELTVLEVDWSALPHVYLDIGCSKPSVASLDELSNWFPPERTLFGTGAPFYYWKGSRLGLEGAELSEQQRRGILGDNAAEIFPWGDP